MSQITTNDFIRELRPHVNFKINGYKRGPLGNNTFSITKAPKNSLKIWIPENAGYEYQTDPDFDQMVMTVREPSRKVPNKTPDLWINNYRITSDIIGKTVTKKDLSNYWLEKLQSYTGRTINFVPQSTFIGTEIKFSHSEYQIIGYSRTNSTTQSFLIGKDESTVFISLLKKKCNTVRQAHNQLRPKGVPKTALRQGEFFFVPVSKKLSDKLFRQESWTDSLEEHSTHSAIITTNRNNTFAIGMVKDRRKNNHKPIILRDWHKVVRNNEVKVDPNVRNYD